MAPAARAAAQSAAPALRAAAAAPSAGAAGAAGAAALLPGDVVRITVWRKPELSGDFRVAEDSTITHPLYRTVRIAGLPLPGARERIGEFLREFDAEPQFVVEPLLRVTVRGEVARPNVYTLAPSTTVAQALALAGGPSERGRRDRVQLLRGATATAVPLAGVGAAGAPIRSGDELVVERQRSIFRDAVMPAFTILGAAAGVASVVLRARR